MRTGIALIAGLAMTFTTGCLAQSPAERPADAEPSRIFYEGTGNGFTGGRTRWWIEPTGRGGYESTEQGQNVSGRFDAGDQGFQQVAALLAPLSGLETMPCEMHTTDQPVGQLSWRYGERDTSLRIEFGCADSGRHEAWNRLGQAVTLVRRWATSNR